MPLGPSGGPAAFLQVDPRCSATVIAGTKNAGLFRSRDGGESWTPLPFPPRMRAALHALVLDWQTPDVILAGLSGESPDYTGILRSADGGVTWRQLPGLRGKEVRAIAIWREDSRVIAAGAHDGVYLTRDGGTNWSRISPFENPGLRPVVSLAFHPADSNVIYAGTPHLPWKTVNGGVTWRRIDAGMLDDSDIFSIQVDRDHPESVFAAACSGIYRSLDGGSTWVKMRGAKGASYRSYTIVQHPLRANVFYAGTTHGLAKSEDGGTTWEMVAPYTTRGISFDLAHVGRIFAATDEAGILRSDNNGKNWREVNRGFCNRVLSWLAVGDGGNLYANEVDGKHGTTLRLNSAAGLWDKVPSGPSRPANPLGVQNPERVLAATDATLLVSDDAGATWKKVDLPELNAGIRAFAVVDARGIAVITTSQTFFWSSDATTWQAGGHLPSGLDVHGLVATGGNSWLMATSSGLLGSKDLGDSWQPIQGEIQGNTITAICRRPTRPSVLFLSRYGIVYTSSDYGHSWAKVSVRPLPSDKIKQLVVVPGQPDRLFALTESLGVYVLTLDTAEREPAGLVARFPDDSSEK